MEDAPRQGALVTVETEQAEKALARLAEAVGIEPPPGPPPRPPRALLKPPDARKRRRLAVRASRRANRA